MVGVVGVRVVCVVVVAVSLCHCVCVETPAERLVCWMLQWKAGINERFRGQPTNTRIYG